MWRKILAFVTALITWVVVASLLNRMLRIGLAGYAAAEPAMVFTVSMQCLRLALGSIASVSAGYVLARLAPNVRRLPLILGGLLLALFLPIHFNLWDKFPVWYHGLFLLSIIPLVSLGARIGTGHAGATRD
jgi:hypothetical protein